MEVISDNDSVVILFPLSESELMLKLAFFMSIYVVSHIQPPHFYVFIMVVCAQKNALAITN